MIQLHDVTKTYRTRSGVKTVLRHASASLQRGRSYGVIGANGAGKSTLLRMIAGVIDPDRGRIVRNAVVSWPLGFGGAFHAELTGVQNARFIARVYGVDTDAMVEFVREFAELGDFFNMPLSVYSSGMRARLAFGVSMAIAFDVYLVDEITAVGDAAFRRKCQAAFQQRLGIADLVIVSHSMTTIRKFCQTVILLEDGALYLYDDLDAGIARHEAIVAASR